MAETSGICRHPTVKVIAEWVEPDTVHTGSCFQWFHCEACDKYWREERSAPIPRGTRLSDVEGETPAGPVVTPATPEDRRAHVVADSTRLHLGWRSIVVVVGLQALVLVAMLWYVFSGVFH